MTAETVTQAVARQDGITAFLQPYRSDFGAVLPTHVNAEQWIRLTTGVLRRNAKLAAVAAANPASVIAAMFDCARLGLVIGDTYHLVPFGNEVVGIADYTGLIELMYRAGGVQSVHCEVVRARDTFHYEPGRDERPTHIPEWFGDRGELVGAYAYAQLKGGGTSQVIVRSGVEIEQVRKVSRSSSKADSPWQQWPDRMWRKTVLRELMKFVPTSAEYREDQAARLAAHIDVVTNRELPQVASDYIDGESEAWDDVEVAKPGGEA